MARQGPLADRRRVREEPGSVQRVDSASCLECPFRWATYAPARIHVTATGHRVRIMRARSAIIGPGLAR